MSRSPTPRRGPDNPAANGDIGHVELQEIAAAKPKLPIEEDIMQLARLGEIKAIQNLFDSGKFSATYADEQNITPLHVCFKRLSTASTPLAAFLQI
jgi:palmitoyltransferase ZDHHC13/17